MRKTVRRLTTRHQAQGLAADLADLFQNLTRGLFDTYRPELHYMRGPGPKWHAKHRQPHVTAEPDLGGAVKIAA